MRGVNLIKNNGSYYLFDGHNDTVQLTDTTGKVTKNYEYDAFGNEKGKTYSDTNPFRYCGEYYDTETGFIYLRARYYDPTLGSFVTEDPAFDGVNWYSYCEGNPVRYIDVSGLNEVELREYAESRGYKVEWNGNTKTATVSKNGKLYSFNAKTESVKIDKSGKMFIQDYVFSDITNTYSERTIIGSAFKSSYSMIGVNMHP